MGISIWQLLIVLAIVLVIFGAKRLRGIGTDLGASVKGFRDAMKEGEKEAEQGGSEANHSERSANAEATIETDKGRIIEAEVIKDKQGSPPSR